MSFDFSGKRALVTGAGKGIGRDLALRLAELGAEVVAVTRTQSDLDELVKINANIVPICCDVGDWEATRKALGAVGPLDFLVNNAAISQPQVFADIQERGLDEILDVNLKSAINISQVVAEGMKSRGGGSIVNVSSIASIRGSTLYSAYGATKAALDQVTRGMAVEYGPHNIRVNSVNPTAIRTKMALEAGIERGSHWHDHFLSRTPLGRLGETEDVVNPVLFLLSDLAAMITGVALTIDGGLTILL